MAGRRFEATGVGILADVEDDGCVVAVANEGRPDGVLADVELIDNKVDERQYRRPCRAVRF